ncbi:MAG: hypothetical protein E6K93_05935 [Thaumarchaeota archaeon]|nr:MAG: hypothetical protein E6K93_05935 [Nitrososphaerota archaeon]
MLEFPIDEIYRRVAKFDALREDKDLIIGSGSGFLYWYNDNVFFATHRDHIIIEEKAFLPDSIILYINTESKNSDGTKITIPLYDKTEKPVWRVLPSEPEQIIVSIPIPKAIAELDYTRYFLAPVNLPSVVLLPVNDITLKIPVSTGVSLSNYFFYSQSRTDKRLQKMIERYSDFKINRKGFATDMTEMVLVLLQHNLDKLDKLNEIAKRNNKFSKKRQEELSVYLSIHNNLVHELEEIMIRFSDELEPSIFDRIQKIFTILKDGNLEDYLVVRHLIQKVLILLGEKILFMQ